MPQIVVREIISTEGNTVLLKSKDGSRVLGRFPFGKGKQYGNKASALEAAGKRERQINFFKSTNSREIKEAKMPGLTVVREGGLRRIADAKKNPLVGTNDRARTKKDKEQEEEAEKRRKKLEATSASAQREMEEAELDLLLVEHGSHNQKSHGRRGSVKGRRRTVSKKQAKKAAKKEEEEPRGRFSRGFGGGRQLAATRSRRVRGLKARIDEMTEIELIRLEANLTEITGQASYGNAGRRALQRQQAQPNAASIGLTSRPKAKDEPEEEAKSKQRGRETLAMQKARARNMAKSVMPGSKRS